MSAKAKEGKNPVSLAYLKSFSVMIHIATEFSYSIQTLMIAKTNHASKETVLTE